MTRIKHSLVALAGLLAAVAALAAPLTPVGAAPEDKEKGPRKFYLTQTTHDGNEVLTACASGYHMASLWEIFEPSNLRYDTALGFTRDDSGSGPPSASRGWIRTGGDAAAGQGNCLAWTSDSLTVGGTVVRLVEIWNPFTTDVSIISPWAAEAPISCSVAFRVWCVQD